jgi:class 3 adenylate cyclase
LVDIEDLPETHYTSTPDGLTIAYQTFGEGPRDLVVMPTTHCIEMMWEEPGYAQALRRLGRMGRVIMLDYRGFGASDPVPLGALPTPEGWMEDTRVVLDAVGSSSTHVVCQGGSTFLGMLFAATYPDRTETLTIVDGWARVLESDDYPIGIPAAVVTRFIEEDSALWGTPGHPPRWAPSRAGDEAFCRRMARFERVCSPPTANKSRFEWVVQLDLRAVLPAIRVPTLVLHRQRDAVTPMVHGRYVAEHIPGARFIVLPGRDHWFFTDDADAILDHVEEFVTGVAPLDVSDRALATVLFTDIVGSTEHAARLGDRQWAKLLDEHDAVAGRVLDRFRGQKVNPTGDGMVATFDGPARAVRCAQAIRDGLRPLGIDVRAGLHTGEIERRGSDIGGIAVHIGARVSALAGPGEVLVSRTVTDLVAGSGIDFEDRGEHELKGVPGTWRVYAVVE